ncbi:hypothetical protein VNO80_07890 [Phaseolus coccineus]|uniref:Uncharacterized protein n=1 Tax=Phaseolus coccineus TaxID=3886 RepID=A0AAN9NJW8_PHACN
MRRKKQFGERHIRRDGGFISGTQKCSSKSEDHDKDTYMGDRSISIAGVEQWEVLRRMHICLLLRSNVASFTQWNDGHKVVLTDLALKLVV